jgi:ABC-2 type transport system ATP-binding protein
VLLLHEGHLLGSGAPGEVSAEIAGRSFHAIATLGRRRLQTRLAELPWVIDAVIQGGGVRVVTTAGTSPDPAALQAEAPDLRFTPVPPRFEDGFVARLQAKAGKVPDAPSPLAGGGWGDGAVPTVSEISHSLPVPHPPPASGGGELPVAARPPGADAEVITVEHLTRRFGAFTAVDNISFAVRRGEIFGLLGANGAGKSTTFRILCGLLPASGGELRVAGFDLRTAAAPARGRIGYMAQKFSLYGDLSVAQNLRFFSSAYRLRGARRAARIAWASSEFELAPILDATARDLPLGFKQRLALACALMHEPDILFLDEPTSGVDPLARREFWQRINALAEAGVTVLVTTHFMEGAEYCDRLVIMAQGRVLAAGEPEAIKATARTDDRPDPTMEDAFIAVIEAANKQAAVA